MNKRQLKKAVMRNVSNLYSEVFEQGRFSKDMAIVCGRDQRGKRMLTTMMVNRTIHEFSPYEAVGVTLEGYVIKRKVI
nr:MAG TPA: hypothetical protein [Caudoviricetes sp.]